MLKLKATHGSGPWIARVTPPSFRNRCTTVRWFFLLALGGLPFAGGSALTLELAFIGSQPIKLDPSSKLDERFQLCCSAEPMRSDVLNLSTGLEGLAGDLEE